MTSRLPIPRLQSQGGGLGRRASAADTGGLEAQAQGQRAELAPQVGAAAAALLEADQGARVSKAVGAASSRMQALKDSLDADPSYEQHGERWEKESRQILGDTAQGAGLLPGRFAGEFEARMGQIGARFGAEVRDGARRKQIDFARASLTEAGQSLSNLAARATDPDQRAAYQAEHETALRGAVRGGLITFEDYQARALAFDRSVSQADRLSALERDPAGVFNELADAESPLNAGLTAAESLEWRKRAADEFSRQLQDRRANVRFQQDQADRAEKQASEAADQKALELLAAGDLAGLQQHLNQTGVGLSRDRRQYYLDRIRSGGGFSDSDRAGAGTNPGAYVDLSNRAAAGLLQREEIDQALTHGLISKADRDRLVQAAADRRFDAAERLLRDSLQQSPLKWDTKTQVRNAEAIRAFTQFRAENPKASETEAIDYARSLVRYTGLKDLSLEPPPVFGPDPAAATQAALAAAAAGQITPDQLDAELQRIEALEDAQKRAGAPK